MYKTESTLGLIGSILSAVFTLLFVAGSAVAMIFIDFFPLNYIFDRYTPDYSWTFPAFKEFMIPVLAICVIVGFVIAAASFILGFIGTAKLKRDDKSGGVLLIVGAVLAFISVVGLIPFALMLVAGIMALSKKQISMQPEINKTV